MWVVIVGLVPILWHLFNLQLSQRPVKEQLGFWTEVLIAYLTVGLFVIMAGEFSELTFGGSVLLSVVAVVAGRLIVKLYFKIAEWMYRIRETQGLVGELKAWVLFDIVMLVLFIIMNFWKHSI